MQYILAVDQGTTSSRALLIDRSARVVAISQKEFKQIFPQPGHVEHDPKEIWASQSSVIKEVMTSNKISSNQIRAIGITNQRETTVVWDRASGEPLYNAIVWQDRRTTAFCEKLKEDGHESMIRKKTGLLLDPYFSGTKIHWILENVPGARKKAEKGELAFGTIDTWLIWNMTKGKIHATDVTNASRTLLFNIHTLDWDDEILKLLDIPKSMLPNVKDCSEWYGNAVEPGFSDAVPICGVAGDQQAALFGQMCTRPGMAKSTYGTGAFLLMNIGGKPITSKNNLITTIAFKIGSEVEYALEGSVFIAGAATQWMRDNLHIIHTSKEMDILAESAEDNGGVYFVPAFTGLGAPHWDPYVRGAIFGISRGTTGAHLARAALEGVAFQIADVLSAMMNDSGISIKELRVDGGMVKSDLLMQFQADLLGVPVIRPKVTELTALGCAFLAGLATDVWKDLDEIAGYWEKDRVFEPNMAKKEVDERRKKWKQALTCAKQWRAEE